MREIFKKRFLVAGGRGFNGCLNLGLTLCLFRFDYVFNVGRYIDHSSYFDGGRDVIDTHYDRYSLCRNT